MCLWSENKIVMYDRPFYYSSQNNTVSYCTLLPCYIALLPWHPTRALGQKLQRVKPWQTMLPWHSLLCLFYMRISVSNVTLSVPCYRTRARVITFLPVFPWRVTYFECHLIRSQPVASCCSPGVESKPSCCEFLRPIPPNPDTVTGPLVKK